jgi:3-deoxy-D-manno-octulosonic-acid transferase
MHLLVRIPYVVAGHLARLAAAVAPPIGGKTMASLRARRGVRARFAAWGAAGRDPSRPLLWVHAASVGEGLQARPVIERVRERHPALQIAYTFFSPSAAPFARGIGADFSDFLPFDTPLDADATLDALRPAALVFSKLDVWPLLASRASARGVRLGMISATFAESSTRDSRLARLLLSDAYRALDAVGAIDENDAERLAALGVRRERISVTGDTRYDQVWARARSADPGGALLGPLASARPTLVAGSTWPADEAALLVAWSAVRERVREARIVIAPHEPTRAHLSAIERWAARHALAVARLGGETQGAADVVLVDKVGVLGDLYALADVAFVGGAFHAAGLHSVVEPAAFGAPVLFGPRHRASRDARLLIEAGGGFAADSAQALAMRILALLTERDARASAGARARALVESGLGAADRSAALVESLLR